MGAVIEPADDPRTDSYLDRTVLALRAGYDRAETMFVRPGISTLQDSWVTRPMTTAFLVVLSSLSFLPVLLFLAFSLAVSGTFMVFAVAAALVASSAVVALAGFLLACTVALLFLVSLVITAFILFALLGVRLFSSIRNNGLIEGTTQWMGDARGQLSDTSANRKDGEDALAEGRHQSEPSGITAESEWSAVDASHITESSDSLSTGEFLDVNPPAA